MRPPGPGLSHHGSRPRSTTPRVSVRWRHPSGCKFLTESRASRLQWPGGPTRRLPLHERKAGSGFPDESDPSRCGQRGVQTRRHERPAPTLRPMSSRSQPAVRSEASVPPGDGGWRRALRLWLANGRRVYSELVRGPSLRRHPAGQPRAGARARSIFVPV